MDSGTKFGRYEIRRKIGAGGMGEVYAAHDEKLGRDVALKVLPSEFLHDAERLNRFQQEARAASALNHPNILTIYEVGESPQGWFIAAELVTGETLREKIRNRELNVLQSIKIALQIADALAAAHLAGIVHRDIKPENLMIRRDGYVKVLDFGLAKPTAPLNSAPEDATVQIVKTIPGMVMGSVRYMSPEQARGVEVDARTDLWSLGVVLFEMLTFKTPFDGETTSDAIAALIYKDAPPLAELLADAPPELARIVRKSLKKDSDERYQTAKDFALDLKNLRDELEFHTTATIKSDKHRFASGENQTAIFPTGDNPIHQTNSANQPAFLNRTAVLSTQNSAAGQNSKWLIFAVLAFGTVGVIVLMTMFFAGFLSSQNTRTIAESRAPFAETQMSRIPLDGKAAFPAISPDGKYLAFAVGEIGNRSLVVRQVAVDSSVTILPATPQKFISVGFAPDGNHIYYVLYERSGNLGALYKIPTLGGAPQKIVEDVDSRIAFAPDGKRLAFIRHNPNEGGDSIFIADLDGANLKPFISTKTLDKHYFTDVAWAANGKHLIVGAGKTPVDKFGTVEILRIDMDDAETDLLSDKKWSYAGAFHALKNDGIVFLGRENNEDASQIWRMDDDGAPEKISNDTNDYNDLAMSADNLNLLALKADVAATMWTLNSSNRELKQLTGESRALDGGAGIRQMSGGKLLFTRQGEKGVHLWTMNADGTETKQLTAENNLNLSPDVSADGKFVVFTSNRGGAARVWRVNADGTNPQVLSADQSDANDHFPQITADGKTVIFQRESTDRGKSVLMSVALDGGTPTPLIPDATSSNYRPHLSPDNRRIAWLSHLPADFKTKINIAPFADGKIGALEKQFDFELINNYSWSPDNKSLIFISLDGVPNLIRFPLDGGKPQALTDFKNGRIFNFTFSNDGKTIFLARGSVNNDLILIRNSAVR